MGRIDRRILSAQNIGDLNGQTAQDDTRGINNVPLALIQIYFRQKCFHVLTTTKPNSKSGELTKEASQVNRLFEIFYHTGARPLPLLSVSAVNCGLAVAFFALFLSNGSPMKPVMPVHTEPVPFFQGARFGWIFPL